MNLIEKIKKIDNLGKIEGCTLEQVKEAETNLGMKFPSDFVEYVMNFGCIDFGATEWTGLNIKGFLNVVTATEREKSVNKSFPPKCFVLEDFNIDAKKVIVSEEGKVYILQYDNVTQIAESISEYLDVCLKR